MDGCRTPSVRIIGSLRLDIEGQGCVHIAALRATEGWLARAESCRVHVAAVSGSEASQT
jgi:hypothetical protein